MSDNKPFSRQGQGQARARLRAGRRGAGSRGCAGARASPRASPPPMSSPMSCRAAVGSTNASRRRRFPTALAGMDARDAALARSIAMAAIRRLGTIRHALAALMDKGLPKQGGAARMAADRRRGADFLSRHARPCRRRSRRARGAARAEDRAFRRSRERRAAQSHPPPRGIARRRSARSRHALLARAALDQSLWRGAGARLRPRPYAGAAARRDGQIGARALGRAARRHRAADRLGAAAHATLRSSSSTAIDDGEWWVQDAAAALPARLLRAEPDERILDMCAAPGRQDGAARLRAARGHRARSLGRAAEAARRQSPARAPPRRHRGRRRDQLPGASPSTPF